MRPPKESETKKGKGWLTSSHRLKVCFCPQRVFNTVYWRAVRKMKKKRRLLIFSLKQSGETWDSNLTKGGISKEKLGHISWFWLSHIKQSPTQIIAAGPVVSATPGNVHWRQNSSEALLTFGVPVQCSGDLDLAWVRSRVFSVSSSWAVCLVF